ncbi:MAG: PorP/SprF family type IX secretion system membrane protein [Bacteroidota bacterium]|nr:PorP/SprF family type IX secretion system membrane protein [Bacteroidota bacterium]
MKKFCVLITLVLLFGSTLLSQKLPLTNQYLINRYVLSPSYAGVNDGVAVFAGYRDQWVGFKGAPITKMVNINSLVGKSVGVGGMIISDQEGIFNRFYGSLSYAYHLNLADEHNLSFGLSGKFFQNSIDLSQSFIQDLTNDKVLMSRQTQNETAFNAGASILYRFKGLNFGLVAPFLIQNKSVYYSDNNPSDSFNYLIRRHYLGHASYDFAINEKFQITPYAIIRMTDAAPLNYEFALQFKYQNQVWLAASYRKEGSIGISAGFLLNDQVSFNYTYEAFGSKLTSQTQGTHDISIGVYLGRGIKEMKEKQKKLVENQDSISTQTEDVKKQLETLDEDVQKEKTKTKNQINILQQRMNDAELEMGKIKTYSDVDKRTEKEKEIDEEMKDIERKLQDIGGEFFVVVEAFKVPENAKKSISLWADRGLNVQMIYNDVRDFYYIYAGKHATYNEALQLKTKLKENGIFGWIYLWAKE